MKGSYSLGHVRGWISCSEPVRQISMNGFAEAFTTHGSIGVKCWIYRGMLAPGERRRYTSAVKAVNEGEGAATGSPADAPTSGEG